MSKFGICQGCKRHRRVSDPQCPFCGEAGITIRDAAQAAPPRRSGRAAYLVLSTATLSTAATLGAACEGNEQAPPTPEAGQPAPPVGDSGAVPVYGAPIGGQDASTPQKPEDPGVEMPVYGVPIDPQPSQVEDAGVAVIPIYGLSVAPFDAGVEDDEEP